MATFVQTLQPTPYGIFDADAAFQTEADAFVTFVKAKLGDAIVGVELTKKQMWSCLEEATLHFGYLLNEYQMKSQITSLLGLPTGSVNLTNSYFRQNIEFLMRMAEPYGTYGNVGGSYDTHLGYIDLEYGRQDYNIYTELKHATSGTLYINTLPTNQRGKLRIWEVMHFEPLAAQQSLLNASNLTNFLATEFKYESYVNSTVFYVLPVFEDVLRRGMLETAFRVRRSNYSYQIIGPSLRIYPTPTDNPSTVTKLWIRVSPPFDPANPAFNDPSIGGVSGPGNVPFANVPYGSINSYGRQWIRQYAFQLAKELLGLIRGKFDAVPVPNAEVRLNYEALYSQAREDKEKLQTQLMEFFNDLTYDKLIEKEANKAENLLRSLRAVPMIKPISIR